ncbi:MAG: FkbM family methyltransferase [Synergistaceae bacterium]|nr:FkbM family methyltransferase [Synergistaceae bacterium]
MFSKLARAWKYLTSPQKRQFLVLRWQCLRRKRFIPLQNLRVNRFSFDVPDAPSFYWQCKEFFDRRAYDFQSANTIPVIYDCGANVGVSVAYFKSRYPSAKIRAFEPDPVVYDYLSRNLKRNNLLEDVMLYRAAVWLHDATISFSPDGADGGRVNYMKVGGGYRCAEYRPQAAIGFRISYRFFENGY